MGTVRAEQYVCNIWNTLLAHTALPTAGAMADNDLQVKMGQWFDARWPQGAPSVHAYWGNTHVAPPFDLPAQCEFGTCVGAIDTVENSASDKRVRAQAYWTPTGIYNNIGIITTANTKNASGRWPRATSQEVTSDGLAESFNGMGLCDDECVELTEFDGHVVAKSSRWFGAPQERIRGVGFSDPWRLVTDTVCITSWFDRC